MSVVLITGAASGLGWALARAFLARGDSLYLVDRNADLLQKRADEMGASPDVATLAADLATPEGVEACVRGLTLCYGRLDVLVNNAGITHRSLALETRPEVFRKVMAVDWQAPVELTLGLYPLLLERGGSIINIGSMAGWMPVMGRAGYCSAKAALGQFFEVLRAEEQGRGIRVLMVYPSFLDTPIEKNALGADGAPASHARSTLGKPGNADQLAAAIVRAWLRGKKQLFPDRFTWMASLLWRVAPALYHRLMRRRFSVELEQR